MNARPCSVEGCETKHVAHGYCSMHLKRWRRHGDPNVTQVVRVRPGYTIADRIEDLEWMAETGECLDGAAARIGMTVKALEKFLARHDRVDLRSELTARQPRDHNKVTDGNTVSRLTATPADRERQNRHRAARVRKKRQESAA